MKVSKAFIGISIILAVVPFVVVMLMLEGLDILTPQPERSEQQTPTPTATRTPTMALTADDTPRVVLCPTITPTTPPTATTEPPMPTTRPISTVAGSPPVQIPPTPVRGGNFAALPLPPNTTVSRTGCASDGHCEVYNFYWAPTHEIVLVNARQSIRAETHEYLHAHQHWAINGGAPLPLSGYDLHAWYATEEGQSFMAAVAGLSFPWAGSSAVNGLEDFAHTGTLWFLDPERLLEVGGQARYDWARENLP